MNTVKLFIIGAVFILFSCGIFSNHTPRLNSHFYRHNTLRNGYQDTITFTYNLMSSHLDEKPINFYYNMGIPILPESSFTCSIHYFYSYADYDKKFPLGLSHFIDRVSIYKKGAFDTLILFRLDSNKIIEIKGYEKIAYKLYEVPNNTIISDTITIY